MNIMYTDYLTKEQNFCCSNPYCNHSDDTCSSYFESYRGMVFPVAIDDGVIVVFCSMASEQENQLSSIAFINQSDWDRRTVCSFPNGYRLYTGVAWNGEELIIRSSDDKGKKNWYSLNTVNVESGEITELYSISANPNELEKTLFLEGTCEKELICKTITVNSYESSSNPEEDVEAMKAATVHHVFMLPYGDDVRPIELLSFHQGEVYEYVVDNSIVYLIAVDGKYQLCQMDLSSFDTRTIIDDFSEMGSDNNIQERPFEDTFIYYSFDNVLLLNHLEDDHLLPDGTIELIYKQYAINLKDGSLYEIHLSNYYNAMEVPITILADAGDSLLVHASVNYITDYSVKREKGMISKKNFLASIDSYDMIKEARELTTNAYK